MPVHRSYQVPESFSGNPPWPSDARATAHSEGPWVRTIGQRQPGNSPHHHKTRDREPRGRAVLLGPLTLLPSTRAPLPNKVSCFVSTCVSSDDSFLSVRQEPALRSWKGSPFLQQICWYIFTDPITSELHSNTTYWRSCWKWIDPCSALSHD